MKAFRSSSLVQRLIAAAASLAVTLAATASNWVPQAWAEPIASYFCALGANPCSTDCQAEGTTFVCLPGGTYN